MGPKRRVVSALAVAAMLLTACGGGGSDGDGGTAAGRIEPGSAPTDTTARPAGVQSDPGGGHVADAWSFTRAEDATDPPGGPEGSTDGAGFAIPMGMDYQPADAGDSPGFEERAPRYWKPGDTDIPAGLEVTDPCSLVTAAEFSAWAGTAVTGAPLVLEGGEACGFIAEGDRLRMAIGVVPVSADDQRFLPPVGHGPDVQPVDGFDTAVAVKRVVWVPRYPVDDSSVLVVEADGFDLVVEMSSRDGRDGASLRDGAAHFATLALGRLP